MFKIVCKSPRTFFTSDKDVTIRDDKKVFFYYHDNADGSLTFNLPCGVYFTSNNLTEKPFAPYVKLPEYETPYALDQFKIIVGHNPHKATITPNKRTILIDRKVANIKYKPALVFMLAHELYHLCIGGSRYDTTGRMVFDAEAACDAFAERYMMARGWNHSQITIAKYILLDDENRIKCRPHDTQNLRR